MVIGILAAIVGLVALLGLLDLTDLLLVRTGKRSMPGWRTPGCRDGLWACAPGGHALQAAGARCRLPPLTRAGRPGPGAG